MKTVPHVLGHENKDTDQVGHVWKITCKLLAERSRLILWSGFTFIILINVPIMTLPDKVSYNTTGSGYNRDYSHSQGKLKLEKFYF